MVDRVKGREWPAEPACWTWPVPEGPATPQAFIDFHGHRCALCGVAPLELILDHDHATRLNRGYLCPGCNGAEGRPGRASAAVFMRYRELHPAQLLGHREPWGSPSASLTFTGERRRTLGPYIPTGNRLERAMDQVGRQVGRCTPDVRQREAKLRERWSGAVAELAGGGDAEMDLRAVLFWLDTLADDVGGRLVDRAYVEAVGLLEMCTESGNDT